ncbi:MULTISPECIES: type II toxin-antitoxin system VapB family antitoxin [unclassified Mesorhizobium]|uniref:type II toxin-antitoxin system VapB family antitoxin n=1 Tax=unclassified Mesorhizobium TaxID=325217 RepID=UPI000BAE9366|nr:MULTISPECIES: type II toxin-antitoxin system VapB family antitoxin [unclassified Mesorhizobium]PBB22903.1 transcriptional regulator [Mesorhizobium sp. WSM4304]PBB71435.1 transcriptional regulator [Mesorhizobium sp. WSM4308]
MNLQIRDPRARELAQRLAAKRKISMTEAVIEALESELERERESGRIPLAKRLAAIADDLKTKAGRGGRPVSKDEIDDMWGHP